MSELVKAYETYRATQERMKTDRAELVAAIDAARAAGRTLEAIGEALGLTRQRVWQILNEGRARQ